MNRRLFLQRSLQAGAAAALALSAVPRAVAAATAWAEPFSLPALPYAYDALAPHIDEETMRIHHTKHHQGYVNNLNQALVGTDWAKQPIEQILANLSQVPADKQTTVRNNAGGHYNHTLFWTLLTPKPQRPPMPLLEAINGRFGTFSKFQQEFEGAAKGVFGSGWAWLVRTPEGKLDIRHTANQDNPLMQVLGQPVAVPILGLDVWEHAYYLKYQNRRAEYVTAFWNVVNWPRVQQLYAAAR